MIKAFNVIILALIFPLLVFGDWQENYNLALTLAKKAEKPLLLAFLEPTCCPWSEKLSGEVLADEQFQALLKDEVLLVKIDPSDQRFRDKFQVSDFPTLVLIDNSEEQIAKIGYLPLNASEFSDHIKGLLAGYFELKGAILKNDLADLKNEVLKKLYLKADHFDFCTFKEILLKAGLKKKKGVFFLMEKYGELIGHGKRMSSPEIRQLRKEILSRDVKNQSEVHLHLAILDFRVIANRHKKRDNTEEAIQPLIEYLDEFDKDPEHIWQIEMMIAQYLFTKNKALSALSHARASFIAAPEDVKPEIAQTIEYFNTFKK